MAAEGPQVVMARVERAVRVVLVVGAEEDTFMSMTNDIPQITDGYRGRRIFLGVWR